MTAPALMNVREVAEYLSLTVSGIYGMVHERTIPFVKLGDKPKSPVRFKVEEIDAWIDARRTEAVA